MNEYGSTFIMENMAFKSTESSSHSEIVKFVFPGSCYVDALKRSEPLSRSALAATSFPSLSKRSVIMSEIVSACSLKQSRSPVF